MGTLKGACALALLTGFAAALPACSSKEPTEERQSFDRLVYAVRQHTVVGEDGETSINVAGGMGQVMDYNRYMPGGRLEVFNLTTGT